MTYDAPRAFVDILNRRIACRCQPPLRSPSAAGPAGPPGVRRALEGAEAEGRHAVWRRGGVCDVSLPDRPEAADCQTPGQAGPGAESPGECQEKVLFSC